MGCCVLIDVLGWGIGEVCGGSQQTPWLGCLIGRAAFYDVKSMERAKICKIDTLHTAPQGPKVKNEVFSNHQPTT